MSAGPTISSRAGIPAARPTSRAPGPPRIGLRDRATIGWQMARAVVANKRIPLIAAWNLTYRCNLRCAYCGTWRDKTPEMSTERVLALVDELASLGTRFVGFSGGETLLREDIGPVVDRCAERGLKVSIQSNATLLPERIAELGRVAELQLSLDGPREVNDAIRGKGTHDAVVDGVEMCRARGIEVCLSTVISGRNAKHLEYVLELAEAHGIRAYFQPADDSLSRHRPTADVLAPERGEYRRALAWLIAEKRRGRKAICNSMSGLRHLVAWPEPEPIDCLAALVAVNIEPDGRLFICDMYEGYQDLLQPIDQGVKAAFEKLRLPRECGRCLSGSRVDFNLLGALQLDTLWGLWQRI